MSTLEILQAHRDDTYISEAASLASCICNGWTILDGGTHRAHVAQVLDEATREQEAKMRHLIRDLTDPGKCWFDHNGGCQEHGYLTLKPGELCPHAEAKQLLGDEATNGR